MAVTPISEAEITANKERFISLLSTINRTGFKKDLLIDKLINSDFFTAPASIRYHGSFKGGLCAHSLRVYDSLCQIVENHGLDISEESLIITSLLHDLSKRNNYRLGHRNVKTYCEDGNKDDRDGRGRYKWETIDVYESIPDEEKFIYGNHEETSEFMIRQFIPLLPEESTAILYHMGGMSYDSVPVATTGKVFGRYPLAVALHLADMIATYFYET